MKKILVLGTGFVVKPLVDYFLDDCKYEVLVASRDNNHSGLIIAGRPKGKRVLWAAKPPYDELDEMVKGVDLVVSMIPPSMHTIVAEACIKNHVNMVTTSYISPEMAEMDAQAKEAGIIILNEIGEDPGMDHMGAQLLIDTIKSEGGLIKSVTSYGAGIPSFEHNNNPLGYKFSWSPSGLIKASQTPAAYIKDGKEIEVSGEDLFKNSWLVDIYKLGTFETYPNRNSIPYLKKYGLDENTDIYRGLLRHPGWCNTMQSFKNLNLFNSDNSRELPPLTFAEFTRQLIGNTKTDNLKQSLANYLNLGINSDIIKQIEWLGFLSDDKIMLRKGSNVDVLVDTMTRKMKYKDYEKDMIIVHNEVVVEFSNRIEKRIATMRVEGRPYGHSAMSRAVSLPAAIASQLILEGTIRQKGVVMPNSQEIYKPVLEKLKNHGYEFAYKSFIL